METNSSRFEWPKEAVLQLITLWQTHECLYNTKDNLYHNKHARNQAFSEIVEGLQVYAPNVTSNDVKTKITYLRAQYSREVAKVREKKSGSGADEMYVPNAFWFKELSFLDDFMKIRKGVSNYNLDDSLDSSYQSSNDPLHLSKKRYRVDKENTTMFERESVEDTLIENASKVLLNITNDTNSKQYNHKDEHFCNYLKAELDELTCFTIKEELIETITLALFEAKKKERVYKNSLTDFSVEYI